MFWGKKAQNRSANLTPAGVFVERARTWQEEQEGPQEPVGHAGLKPSAREIFSPSREIFSARLGGLWRTRPPGGLAAARPGDVQRRHPRSWPCPSRDGGGPRVIIPHRGAFQPPWVTEIGGKRRVCHPSPDNRTLWGWVQCRVMPGGLRVPGTSASSSPGVCLGFGCPGGHERGKLGRDWKRGVVFPGIGRKFFCK